MADRGCSNREFSGGVLCAQFSDNSVTSARSRSPASRSPSIAISLRDRVARFVTPQIAAAGQADGGQEAPPLIADSSASDALCAQPIDLLSYVVAHEVEF